MLSKNHEVDVFTIPHCRIKQLVHSCTEKLISTDFTNSDELISVLNRLFVAFKEFKSHEEIENEFIMKRLKNKLKEMKIHNSAVCNCHSDDQFSPLLSIVDSGYFYLNKQKSPSDKLNYGHKLRKALKEFVKGFLPHMKEEEEVFQPLLMQYFTEKELMEMKIIVIKSHMQQRKLNLNLSGDDPKTNLTIEHDKRLNNQNISIDKLPDEILMKICSQLKFKDLLKSAKVCRKWNKIVNDPFFWETLSFDECKSNSNKDDFLNDDLDEIDHSDEEDCFNENEPIKSKNDVKLLRFWIKRLLPRVGNYVKNLDLRNCKALNSNLANRIFQLCPNLNSLNLSYSNIKDNAFKGINFNQIQTINFEACTKITDKTINYLFSTRNSVTREIVESIDEEFSEKESCVNSDNCKSCFSKNNKNTVTEIQSEIIIKQSLKSINFSGCFGITDKTLEHLMHIVNLNNLIYLNLSGCSNISSKSLDNFVKQCQILKPDNVYFCDNIQIDGINGVIANGCENVECYEKFCCRN